MAPLTLWRRWADPSKLVGVRFGCQTCYGLLDIDAHSPYCNPEAIAGIQAVLETVGICRTLPTQSSWSGGVHLYVPLPEAVSSFGIACVISECLKAHSFNLEPGQREVFPNAKTYGVERFIEYNGHRLPLQPESGSYLLDGNLSAIGDRLDALFQQWEIAAAGQDISALRAAIPHAREARKQVGRRRQLSAKAEEWKLDLEAQIEAGWSGPGQTNEILKAISCHGVVFLNLEGNRLTEYVQGTAVQLPGYRQHCGHQHEIRKKAAAWSRSVEKFYWPIGSRPRPRPSKGDGNQKRAELARERIMTAAKQVLGGETSTTIRGLAQRLVAVAKCSLQTLYKHLELWHPSHRLEHQDLPVTAPLQRDTAISDRKLIAQVERPNPCRPEVLHLHSAGYQQRR